jgi:hypothetical protein
MRETRITAAPVEVREAEDGTATIAGYAATFGDEYEVFGFTESVDPRAFKRTLKNNGKDLAVVWSHDADRVLGTVASGTARFEADDHGLRYEADLDLEDPDGISAWRKITTGKVTRSSFSFEPVKDKWEERDDAPPHRTILEAKLYEASPVLFPANPGTEVDVKRAVASYAEYRGVSIDADSIEQVRNATTPDPDVDPPQALDATQDSEPTRVYIPLGC